MTIRQELHGFIDEIAESKLEALRPLLSVLAEDTIVIETDLTDEERRLIAEGKQEYRDNPASFTPLEDVR